MKAYFIKENDFSSFLGNMMKATKVIGPVAKKNKFMYRELRSPEELRLDYDVTLLPAKECIFPTKQELLKFDQKGVTSSLNPTPQILFGVHFYEIKAIDMLDKLFEQGHADKNYLANREVTTVVGSNIQRVGKRAFWATVGPDVSFIGHDAFLTKISGGYTFEVISDKGEKLVSHGQFSKASDAQIKEAQEQNQKVLNECPESLKWSTAQVSEKVRAAFEKKEIWDHLSKDCFSCGTCNIVCPTCYCFDVQDLWNLEGGSGCRVRSWDGCLLEDFAQVSLGGGQTENFREERADRFRHRVMRKSTYLNDKIGGPACVGCGRCSEGCVPDIADPVHIVERIMEG